MNDLYIEANFISEIILLNIKEHFGDEEGEILYEKHGIKNTFDSLVEEFSQNKVKQFNQTIDEIITLKTKLISSLYAYIQEKTTPEIIEYIMQEENK